MLASLPRFKCKFLLFTFNILKFTSEGPVCFVRLIVHFAFALPFHWSYLFFADVFSGVWRLLFLLYRCALFWSVEVLFCVWCGVFYVPPQGDRSSLLSNLNYVKLSKVQFNEYQTSAMFYFQTSYVLVCWSILHIFLLFNTQIILQSIENNI